MLFSRAVFVAGITLTLATQARGQAELRASTSPAAVVQAYLENVFAGRWEAAAGLLDPDAVAALRFDYLNDPDTWATPTTPLSRVRAVRAFALDSMEQLARLSGPDLAIRWVQAHDFAYTLDEQLAAQGCSRPDFLDGFVRSRRAMVYGAVERDNARAFVLFRKSWPGVLQKPEESEGPAVAHLRRTSVGWRILPRSDFMHGSAPQSLNECPKRG